MMSFVRWAAALGVAALLTAMLGPFQGAERHLGLTDGAAHAIAFGFISVALLVLLPRRSLLGPAALAVMLAVGVEVVQWMTGRDASVHDLIADGLGIAVVVIAEGCRRRWF